MTQRLGWWEYDANAPGLVNTVTGEAVVYRGVLGGNMRVRWSETWLRYDYIHSELTFPLLARTRERDDLTEPRGRLTCLCVDYPRSAQLWRDDPFGNRVVGTAPAYGVWRRIDDCLVDAFTCWPDGVVGAWDGDAVEFVGGWLDGVWRQDFSRLSIGGQKLEATLSRTPAPEDMSPRLMDLSAQPGARWQRVLPGRDDGGEGGMTPEGIAEGRAPILETSDGRSTIYGPDTGGSPADGGIFTYVSQEEDAPLSFLLEAASRSRAWQVHLAWPAPSEGEVQAVTTWDWLQRSWAVIDAFAAWNAA